MHEAQGDGETGVGQPAQQPRGRLVVNNAGIGLFGAFEATPMATAREVFETNTFGVMAMTQAVLPQFCERRAGVVVNVTSSATLAPMPLVAVYTASKTASAGFTASLAFELDAFNVRVKLVEPGYGPSTRFTENGGARMAGLIPDAYDVRAAHARGLQPTARDHYRDRRGRGGLARGAGHVRPAPLPGGGRRRGAGTPRHAADGAADRDRLRPPAPRRCTRSRPASPEAVTRLGCWLRGPENSEPGGELLSDCRAMYAATTEEHG